MSPRTAKQYEEIKKEKLDLIKATALELFAGLGFHGTSISMIAKRAGISKGLMYNYFESKEALLTALFSDYVYELGSLINPDSDDEITNAEMEGFFLKLIDSFKHKNNYWKLFFQLSMQQEVLALLLSKIENGEIFVSHVKLLNLYFVERFENPQQETLLFNSIIKGFSLMYIFAPETVSSDMLDAFLARLKQLFIRDKLNVGSPEKSGKEDKDFGNSHLAHFF